MFHYWQILSVILLLALITSWGGFLIASKGRGFLGKWQGRLVGLGMGILLGISFLEFLPQAMEYSPQLSPFLIIGGLVLIVLVEAFIAPKLNFLEGSRCNHDHAKDHDHKSSISLEHQHHLISHQAACSAVGCLVTCAFFDGLEITTAFYLGKKTGVLTSLGLVFHILPDGILAANIALAGGMPPVKARFISVITGLSLIAGSVFAIILTNFLFPFHLILPVATGILIYVSLVHLLPVAMKQERGLWPLLGLLFFTLLKHH